MSAGSGPSPNWIRVCAWCGIVLPGEEGSRDPAAGSPQRTHGICPSCREAFLRAAVAARAATESDGPSPGETLKAHSCRHPERSNLALRAPSRTALARS